MRHLMLGIATACAFAGAACYRNTRSYSPNATTVLQVQNQSFDDMNIYVLPEGGTQVRLGTALGKKDSYFDLPGWVLQGTTRSLRFVARPIATQHGPVSDQISATPGDTLVLIIPPS